MKRLIVAGILTILAVPCLVLPLSYTMTGLCLLGLAAVCALTWLLDRKNARPVWKESLMVLTLVGILLLQSIMGAIYGVGMAGLHQVPRADWAVVLGAQVKGEQISSILQSRLDAALLFLEENPNAKVVVSGGQGPGEDVTEASAMYEYLVLRGVNPDRIVQEDRASNTRENLANTRALLQAMGEREQRLVLITSEFHLARAKFIADTLGIEVETMGAETTQWISKMNYYLREVFALAKAAAVAVLA
ncbi:MAG: YdcF family protein [Clostridiales bacterium]|nr:YdcF family protein [Clostridiales bacterium]